MADDTAPAPALAPPTLTLGGRDFDLVPSLNALRAVERLTGCTIFTLVEAGAAGGITIDQLTAIAVCLVDVADDDPVFGIAGRAARDGLGGAKGMGIIADRVAAELVEHGVANVLPRLVVPLALALAGKVDAAGKVKPVQA